MKKIFIKSFIWFLVFLIGTILIVKNFDIEIDKIPHNGGMIILGFYAGIMTNYINDVVLIKKDRDIK